MRQITLYTSNTTGNVQNTSYPNKRFVAVPYDLVCVAEYDHTPCFFGDGERKDNNILSCDNVCLDIDNTHTENEAEWVTFDKIQATLKDVCCYLIPSRNHEREKDGKKARPKYHLYFPLAEPLTSAEEIRALKRKIYNIYPSLHFDERALEASKFFFGYKEPKPAGATYIGEDLCVDTYLADKIAETPATEQVQHSRSNAPIYEGSRNNDFHAECVRIFKRYGETQEAYNLISQQQERLTPPLPQKEVESVIKSALRFYSQEVKTRSDYIAPEFYNLPLLGDLYTPLTDTSQAELLATLNKGTMMFSPQTGWLVYNGKVWEEDKQGATVERVKELHSQQLDAVNKAINGLWAKKDNSDGVFDKNNFDEQLKMLKKKRNEVVARQSCVCIKHTLELAESALSFDFSILDDNPYLLNTPAGPVDLRTGKIGQHSSEDYCSKITQASPSKTNAEMWQSFLNDICESNAELVEYLQMVCGSHIIGQIANEQLVIHQGGGANGKSTLNNAILEVLGGYGLTINAELLTTKGSQVYRYQISRLRGARYVVGGEFGDNITLDTALLKQLCSTDYITAEQKFKDPMTFRPSHHITLYTNHAPDVRQMDVGTWRRLNVVPFNARFENSKKKNYARTLVKECGGAILQWLIDGAKKFIANDENIHIPQCVKDFTEQYKQDCDWVAPWIAEKCNSGSVYKDLATVLYRNYKDFAIANGEYIKSNRHFYKALEAKGYKKIRTNMGYMIYGLEIKSTEFQEMGEY